MFRVFKEVKRGEIWFNSYTSRDGQEKRVPILVVSPDERNERSQFITAVRLSRGTYSGVGHVSVPQSAFTNVSSAEPMSDSTVYAETVSSVRKDNLKEYVCDLTDEDYMKRITDEIQGQIGVRKDGSQAAMTREKLEMQANRMMFRPTETAPWYSADISPQKRDTAQTED